MEISVRRIHSFLNGFISNMERTTQIWNLMSPTCDITTEDGTKTCRIIDMNINKIIELTERRFSVDDIYRINYRDKEKFYIMSNLILDKRRIPLLYVKKTTETSKFYNESSTQTYDIFYVSNEVMLDTKSWICFVIRKYIIYYILDGSFLRKKVHVINGQELSVLVRCRINKFTSKNIAKLKIINGDND